MRRYYKFIIVALIAAVTVWLVQWDATQIPASAITAADDTTRGNPAPDVTFARLDGGKIVLHSLNGKPVWLHFWASWCAPCRAEFRGLLERISADHAKPVLLAVSADANAADAEKFMAPYRQQFPTLFAAGQVIIGIDSSRALIEGRFQTFQYPETIIIDANGIMQQKIVGVMRATD